MTICTNTFEVPGGGADVAEARAALPFSLGYLPAGLELVEEAGTQCGDKILTFRKAA